MSAIHQTARYRCKPESVEKCREAIREFVEYIRTHEPETLVYTAMQEQEDETAFLHYFVFQDEAAQERHANSEGVARFTAVLYPECVAPVEFTAYRLIAAR